MTWGIHTVRTLGQSWTNSLYKLWWTLTLTNLSDERTELLSTICNGLHLHLFSCHEDGSDEEGEIQWIAQKKPVGGPWVKIVFSLFCLLFQRSRMNFHTPELRCNKSELSFKMAVLSKNVIVTMLVSSLFHKSLSMLKSHPSHRDSIFISFCQRQDHISSTVGVASR